MNKFVLAIFFLPSFICKSQVDSVQKIKFGFSIGGNYSELGVNETNSAVSQVSTFSGPGFRTGFIADQRINARYSFIPVAELSFNETGLYISYPGGASHTKRIYPVTLELAPHLAIKATDKDSRPCLLLGPSVKIPLASRASNDVINTKTTTIAFDLGFCFDKRMKYFFLGPELRYSLGLNRITNLEGVRSARFHSVSLLLNFKG